VVRDINHLLAGLREFYDMAADVVLEVVQKFREEGKGSLFLGYPWEVAF
jgi:hypothetical protein